MAQQPKKVNIEILLDVGELSPNGSISPLYNPPIKSFYAGEIYEAYHAKRKHLENDYTAVVEVDGFEYDLYGVEFRVLSPVEMLALAADEE